LNQVGAVNVEVSVVLGRSILPMQQLLRMGRGAVIPLDAKANDEVWILVNNHPIARGEIQISEDKICISVTGPADVYDFMAGSG
jgi:flagellar motor switch protein FliN/FliY